MRGVSAGRVVWIGGMCEERSNKLMGFCRHYGRAPIGIMLSLRSTSDLTSSIQTGDCS